MNAALSASPAQSAYVTPLRLNLFRSAMNAVGFSPPACPNSIFSVEFGVDFFFYLSLSLCRPHLIGLAPSRRCSLFVIVSANTTRVFLSCVDSHHFYRFPFSFEIPHY